MVLDVEVKRRINNCRDILVGKVPDPKAQIEQITVALIYKFMDDIDKESGRGLYFKDELEEYSWEDIMDPKLSGEELFKKYTGAIELFQTAKHFPEFFRSVFSNTYVPYKDARTLKMFLTEISNFDYGDSEKLGDAFEYLLSIMGSQGDAGQFRTPRHIIDFIVEILKPKIGEKIMDPACGTAGFLISAFKFMQGKNKRKLSSVEMMDIRDNLFGFDISPDMVRMAKVNMFLHGFENPEIKEFDTLGKNGEENWNARYDVILANPPFMTPKGGIKPHELFSVESNRAEVLFTDYISDHLKSDVGRAGVIVPEGIIFQSGKAYRDLRKRMVKDRGLYAVVSLPAGVFNPYSGVKTSILFFDKGVKSENFLFVKVKGDGFDLGAQRRDLGHNGDLDEVLEVVEKFREGKLKGTGELFNMVSKEKILESGDVNLSGDRYRDSEVLSSEYPFVELKEVCEISSGNSAPQRNEYFDNGNEPFFRTSDVGALHISKNMISSRDYINKKAIIDLKMKLFPKGTILFPKSGASTFLNHRVMMGIEGFVSSHLATIKANSEKVLDDYLYYQLLKIDAKNLCPDQAYPSLKLSQISSIKIPLPPIEVQKRIVEEIEGYQKIVDGARVVVDNYKPRIKVEEDWERVELGNLNLFKIESGGTPSSTVKEFWNGNLNWVTLADLPQNEYITNLSNTKRKITDLGLQKSSAKMIPINSVLISSRATIGRVAINNTELSTNQGFKNIIIQDFNRVNVNFLAYILKSFKVKFQNLATGGTFKEISKSSMVNVKIPLPPIEVQKRIVEEIKEEQGLVDANKKLVEIFEEKIGGVISGVWGKDGE